MNYYFQELALPAIRRDLSESRRILVEEPQSCETICHIRPCHFTSPMFTIDDIITFKNYTERLAQYLLPRKIYDLVYK